MATCPWCQSATGLVDDPDDLCREHQAEYRGLTLDELDEPEYAYPTYDGEM